MRTKTFKHHTLEQKKAVLEEYKNSTELTVAEVAEKNGVAVATIYRWLKELRDA